MSDRKEELDRRPSAEEITLAIAGIVAGEQRDGGLYHAAVVQRVRPIIEAAMEREWKAALASQTTPVPG